MNNIARALIVCAGLIPFSAGALEIELTPGQLEHQLLLMDAAEESLILKGEAEALDLRCLSKLPATVKTIDMSELSLIASELPAPYYGASSFQAGEIPPYIFMGLQAETLKLPQATTIIGDGAFATSRISSITLPAVSTLGRFAFHDCRNLQSVDFTKATISELPSGTFRGCTSLQTALFAGTVTSVGDRAFYNSGIRSVSLPGAVYVGDYAFALAPRLEQVVLASNCKLGDGAFFGDTDMTALAGYDGNSGSLTFAGSGMTELPTMVNSATIQNGMFAGSDIRKVRLGSKVTRIEANAFRRADHLEAVDVSELGTNCPEADAEAFAGLDLSKVILYVEDGKEDHWKSVPVWREFDITGRTATIDNLTESPSALYIYLDGDILTVKAETPITEFSVYSLDGKLLTQGALGNTVASVSAAGFPEVIIVKAADKVNTKILKIRRNG